jgi:protein-S-isoprenylcysteine O-methyltransferase Ste14
MLNAHIILTVLWILFGVLHSVLASLAVKQWFANMFPQFAKHYRLLYTLFAFINFAIVLLYQVRITSPFVYQPTLATTVAGVLASVTGLLIMGICIKKYFLSLSGLKSLFQEKPAHELMIGGIHRYVRHPLYLGTFLAIWGGFLVYPVLSFFISNVVITLYTITGITFEEKKLVAEFGPAYETYRQQVPKLLPAFRRKNR